MLKRILDIENIKEKMKKSFNFFFMQYIPFWKEYGIFFKNDFRKSTYHLATIKITETRGRL
tara:strand:+ start:291 stop:473 length:183 start_codon:yes stop_codon:yes gene_type:complete